MTIVTNRWKSITWNYVFKFFPHKLSKQDIRKAIYLNNFKRRSILILTLLDYGEGLQKLRNIFILIVVLST